MKTLSVIWLGLIAWTKLYGQDGSDIRYFKVYGVDSSLIGSYVHFDFFHPSFRSRNLDTVTPEIDDKPVKFKEVRTDDGVNNWFSRLHLQSIEKFDGFTARVSKFRLDSLPGISFHVTMFLEFYDSNGTLMIERSRQQAYRVDKTIVTEVLVKS